MRWILCVAIAFSTGSAFCGTVDCSKQMKFVDEVVCESRERQAIDDFLSETIVTVRETTPEEFKVGVNQLVAKRISDRDYCVTKQCIERWYDLTVGELQALLDTPNTDLQRFQKLLDASLGESLATLYSDGKEPTEKQHQEFSSLCSGNALTNGPACLYASFRDYNDADNYVNATCQREKGAVSGLACAVQGSRELIGAYKGHEASESRAVALFEKGCAYGSSNACLTLGDWHFLKGNTSKAEEAYGKAVKLGDDGSRLALVSEDPDLLSAWIQSHHTPAQDEYASRCMAAYPSAKGVRSCMEYLRASELRQLSELFKALNIDDGGSEYLTRTINSRRNSIFNLFSDERFGTEERHKRAPLIANSLLQRTMMVLAEFQQGHFEQLYDELDNRCNGLCTTAEETAMMARRRVSDWEQKVSQTIGGMESESIKRTFHWLINTNEKLASILVKELRNAEGTELLQALVLSDIIFLVDTAEAVF